MTYSSWSRLALSIGRQLQLRRPCHPRLHPGSGGFRQLSPQVPAPDRRRRDRSVSTPAHAI